MKSRIVWKDKSKRIVLKSVLIGHFAMWAVRQSPYLSPNDLDTGIEEFNENFVSSTKIGNADIIETTYIELEDNIKNAISYSDTISSWNIAKKGAGPIFVSMYSEPKPDYDFIDLEALARNIAQSVWLEISYNDGAFESVAAKNNGKN